MSPPKLNDLVGDWVAGKSQIENRNPSDLGDREDIFAQANAAQLAAALDHFLRLSWTGQPLRSSSRILPERQMSAETLHWAAI